MERLVVLYSSEPVEAMTSSTISKRQHSVYFRGEGPNMGPSNKMGHLYIFTNRMSQSRWCKCQCVWQSVRISFLYITVAVCKNCLFWFLHFGNGVAGHSWSP